MALNFNPFRSLSVHFNSFGKTGSAPAASLAGTKPQPMTKARKAAQLQAQGATDHINRAVGMQKSASAPAGDVMSLIRKASLRSLNFLTRANSTGATSGRARAVPSRPIGPVVGAAYFGKLGGMADVGGQASQISIPIMFDDYVPTQHVLALNDADSVVESRPASIQHDAHFNITYTDAKKTIIEAKLAALIHKRASVAASSAYGSRRDSAILQRKERVDGADAGAVWLLGSARGSTATLSSRRDSSSNTSLSSARSPRSSQTSVQSFVTRYDGGAPSIYRPEPTGFRFSLASGSADATESWLSSASDWPLVGRSTNVSRQSMRSVDSMPFNEAFELAAAAPSRSNTLKSNASSARDDIAYQLPALQLDKTSLLEDFLMELKRLPL